MALPHHGRGRSTEGYLKNLNTSGELAAFLSIRGMCLREHGRTDEAAAAFAKATQLAPACRSYATMHAQLDRQARDQQHFDLTINKGR